MPVYDPKQLGRLLTQWGSGNLDNIQDHGHVVVGMVDAVVTGAGVTATGLCQRFTCQDVDIALENLLRCDRDLGIFLICRYLLNWTVERLSRALGHASTSITQSWLILAEDALAGALLDAN